MVDKNKDDDDFSFPEEGEYQFDETHDFESEESSFDDSEDFGFTVDEPLEPEPMVAPAKKATEKPVKKVAGSQQKSKKPLLVMVGLLLFAVISYVMFYNRQGASIPVPKSPAPQQTAAIKTLPMPGTAPSTQPVVVPSVSGNEPAQVSVPVTNQPSTPTQQPTIPVVTTPATTTNATSNVDMSSNTATPSIAPQATLDNASQDRITTLETKANDFSKTLDDLKTSNDKNAEQLKSLTNSITALAEQTQRLNQALSLIVSAAATSSSQTTTTTTTAVSTPAVEHYTPKALTHTPPPKTVSRAYLVDAVIPGRAWLKNKAGKSLSVEIGDSIPGYGKVTRIDPTTSIVTMSTGTRFDDGRR